MLADPTSISTSARIALDRFETAFENARSETNPRARVRGNEIIRLVKATMPAVDVAILELVVGRGRSFAALAEMTGRKAHDLRIQFAGAAERLAKHFEATADQEI